MIWMSIDVINRGVRPTSRLASYHPDRFIAFGFLAACYAPPNPVHNPAAQAEAIRKLVGRDIFAYWDFFTEEGADKKIEQNVSSLWGFPLLRSALLMCEITVRLVLLPLLPEPAGVVEGERH